MIPSLTATRSAASPARRGDGESDVGGIRPRNRRVGGLSAAPNQEQELLSTSSATSTPGGSRAVSPLPAKYPSRRTGRSPGAGNANGSGSLLGPPARARSAGTSSPILGGAGFGSTFSGLGLGKAEGGWMSSWNALQGLASSVLGGAEDGGQGSTYAGRRRKDARPIPKKQPDNWGPPSRQDSIGEGSTAATAEREALVRAKKMTRVLEGRDEPTESRDTNGKFKLRSSIDEPRPGSSQEDEQALVYIHHVQKNDTLQGVVLRYNCKPDVFRKANRFWPNDSIQVRKTVILPVDACTVKGRPCDPPDPDEPNRGVDLLAPTPLYEEPPQDEGIWPSASAYNGKSAEVPEQNENGWIHVRWVLIDGLPNSKPVEIARMPRKTLGYFPPRRRKSQATISTVSTPRASLDFPASTITPLTNMPDGSLTPGTRRQSNLGPSSHLSSSLNIGSYFPPIPMSSSGSAGRPRRERRESVSEAADRMGWMRGPGGVGTLSVRRPGPGNDGLNAWARKHFSTIAIDSLPSTSIQGAEQAHFGFDGELASIAEGAKYGYGGSEVRRELGVGTQGQGMGLENAAAAVEGWVRKLGKATVGVGRPGTPKGNLERGGREDLIELVDGAGSDDGRWELSQERIGRAAGTPRGGLSVGLSRERERGTSAKGAKGD